jgi:hypothetical protein
VTGVRRGGIFQPDEGWRGRQLVMIGFLRLSGFAVRNVDRGIPAVWEFRRSISLQVARQAKSKSPTIESTALLGA